MKASLFSYVISAALSFATIATASKPVENDTCLLYTSDAADEL